MKIAVGPLRDIKNILITVVIILIVFAALGWRYYSDPGRNGINVDKFAKPLMKPIQDSLKVVVSYDSKIFQGRKGANIVGGVRLKDFYSANFRNRDGNIVFALYVFAFENGSQASVAKEELESIILSSYLQITGIQEYGPEDICLAYGDTASRFVQGDGSLVVLWGKGLPATKYPDRCEFEGIASLAVERLDECLREKYC